MSSEQAQEIKRLGIFGGTFDPPHLGHLLLAEHCLEQCPLDMIWLLPAAVAPHKQKQPFTPCEQRLEMLKLAIGGHPAMEVCPLEIDRGGVSYTVDTLSAIHAQLPNAELFLLMGADTLEDLPNWREPQKVCQLALPVVVCRPGREQPDYQQLGSILSDERVNQIKATEIDAPLIEISSSEIRWRVEHQKSIRYQTPRAVQKYIEAQRLYQRSPS